MSDNPNGIGLPWLEKMRTRKDIVKMMDFRDSHDCFSGVSIAGGVCYYLIQTGYSGVTDITYKDGDEVFKRVGELGLNGFVVRDFNILNIIDKVKAVEGMNYAENRSIKKLIGTNRMFSPNDSYFATNWIGFSLVKTPDNYIRYYPSSNCYSGDAWVSESDLAPGTESLMHRFKCFLILSGPTNNLVIKPPFIGGVDSCCSRTYAPMFGDEIDDAYKASNMIQYFKTKFFRILVKALKTTQHATFIRLCLYKTSPLNLTLIGLKAFQA